MAKTRGVSPESLEGYRNMMVARIPTLSPEDYKSWADNQVYIALGNLMTSCAVKGIDTCAMEGFDKQQYDAILGLSKKGLASAVVCAIGYRSDDDKYAQAKKVRFEKEKIIEVIG